MTRVTAIAPAENERLPIKQATEKAIQEVMTWPGEFLITDVITIARRHMGVSSDAALERMLAPRYRHPENVAVCLRHTLREWVNVRLRKMLDEYGLRRFICYRIKGHRLHHWLLLDNLSLKTLDYITSDRTVLTEEIESLTDILARARVKMEAVGGGVVFGDVKGSVMEQSA
jgi:hypothetical protein